jgi:hypothetical protein
MIHLLVVYNKYYDSHFFTYINPTDHTTEIWSVSICSQGQLLKIYDSLRNKILSFFVEACFTKCIKYEVSSDKMMVK